MLNYPKKGTRYYALASCDWSDLDAEQIAEVLDTTPNRIRTAINNLKKRYGITVEYKHRKPGKKKCANICSEENI